MLAVRLKPERLYKPLRQSRDLDKLERGYWFLLINLVDGAEPLIPARDAAKEPPCENDWDMPFFSRFWSFLSDFISKEGRAGWGVWCVLEDAAQPLSRSGHAMQQQLHARDTAASAGTASAKLLTLKVYAWGETVMHIYLLLFLASERRIRKMAAQWRDSRENVIIQMP